MKHYKITRELDSKNEFEYLRVFDKDNSFIMSSYDTVENNDKELLYWLARDKQKDFQEKHGAESEAEFQEWLNR